jgi:hypothetical protein
MSPVADVRDMPEGLLSGHEPGVCILQQEEAYKLSERMPLPSRREQNARLFRQARPHPNLARLEVARSRRLPLCWITQKRHKDHIISRATFISHAVKSPCWH